MLSFAACKARPPQSGSASAGTRSQAASAVVVAAVCDGSGPHAKHASAGFACVTCHPGGGLLGFSDVTFPGGTRTAGGTVVFDGPATTCTVGCHGPLGAEPLAVAWNHGPLACVDCHRTLAPGGSLSSHPLGSVPQSISCDGCHDLSRHTSGQVVLLYGTGDACVACHSGQGQTLGDRTPPLLVGWGDAARGDFHGARGGTCRFDQLDVLGARSIGQGGLPCPGGQPDAPGGLRITPHWWYASGIAGRWESTCDLETVDANGSRIGSVVTHQPCPAGTILNWNCGPQGDPDCYPTTLVIRGFGGTLLPPHARGHGELTCGGCHDFHGSTNSFLLAARVNGVTIAPGTIDRAGVGAQALCNACHSGQRHEVCMTCHRAQYVTDGIYWWFEGPVVDPAPDGSACFYCHGHEGILQMEVATPAYPGGNHPFGAISGGRNSNGRPECSHCHSSWKPPPTEYVPPRITAYAWSQPNNPSLSISGQPDPQVYMPVNGVVFDVTPSSAKIYWETDERATSWVEYGVGTAGYFAGNGSHIYYHQVTLAGLTPGTTYIWRVRTSDRFRNVTEPPLQTFTTLGNGTIPRPVPVPLGTIWGGDGGTTAGAWLQWSAVAAPSGNPVQYRAVLGADPNVSTAPFATPSPPYQSAADSGWIDATSFPVTLVNLPDECSGSLGQPYYWKVIARDAVLGTTSDWSFTDRFYGIAMNSTCW